MELLLLREALLLTLVEALALGLSVLLPGDRELLAEALAALLLL
jgi:hypothetical protein